MHDDARKALLGSILPAIGHLDGGLEEFHQVGIEADFQHGTIGCNMCLAEPQLGNGAVETDIILVPPHFFRRRIGVPLAGEETKERAFGKRLHLCTIGGERTGAFGYIQQLELLQNTPLAHVEEISRRVVFEGVMLACLDALEAHGIDIDAKVHIGLCGVEITDFVFQIVVGHVLAVESRIIGFHRRPAGGAASVAVE